MSDESRPLILIVDDDRVVHSIFARALASFPGTMIHAHDGQEALAIGREARPDLLITDALLPKHDFLADVYLGKPVSPGMLWEVIEKTLHISRPIAASSSTHEMSAIEAVQERGAM